MPKKETHIPIGILIGCGAAGYKAKDQEPFHALLEIIGGGAAGYCGTRLPDKIEPSLSPKHRKFFHSIIAGVSTGLIESTLCDKWIKWCRTTAEYYRMQQLKSTVSDVYKFFCFLIEVGLRILAGMLTGLTFGYMSHLYLDGTTPAGLPII